VAAKKAKKEWTRETEHYKDYYKAVLKESDLEYFEESDVSEPEEDGSEDESDVEIESEDEEALQKVRATVALVEVFGGTPDQSSQRWWSLPKQQCHP
jgi:hypothetical protein